MANDTEMTYFAKFKIDVSEFLGGINQAQSGFLAFYRDVTVSLNMTMQIFDRVIAQVQKFGQMAQELKDFSYQTGLSTDKIQQLQYAATLAGTDFGTVSISINRLSLAIDEAGDSSTSAAKAFSRLGVTPSGKTVDQVFDDTATALVNMKDVTERNRIAMDLFGRSYKDLLPYMDTYVKNAKEISEHPGLTKEEIDQLEDGKVAWDRLTSSFTIYSGKVLAFVEGSAWRKLTESHTALPAAVKAQMTAMEEANYEVYGIIPERLQSLMVESGAYAKPFVSTAQEASGAAGQLKDRYAGLSDAEIDLLDATDGLAAAQKDQAKALKEGDSEAYDKASRLVQTYTNRVKELTAALNESASASKAAAATGVGWSDKSIVGSPGSEERSFLTDEMNNGADYQTAMDAWRDGAHSYSHAGDFATMGFNYDSSAFLAAGGSQEQWDLIYGSSAKSGSGTGSKTAAAPGSKEQTKSVQSEYDSQGKAAETLTGKITTEYQKQADAYKAYIESITASREENYPILESMDLTHWATSEEIARVAEQAMLEFMATAVNFGGQNPIIQNMIVVSKDGPDWEPPAFVAVTAPKLTSADFSSVGASVQAIVAKGMGDGTSGTASAKKAAAAAGTQIYQTFNGVDLKDPDKTGNAAAKGANRAMAGVEYLGGAMI